MSIRVPELQLVSEDSPFPCVNAGCSDVKATTVLLSDMINLLSGEVVLEGAEA